MRARLTAANSSAPARTPLESHAQIECQLLPQTPPPTSLAKMNLTCETRTLFTLPSQYISFLLYVTVNKYTNLHSLLD